MPQRLLAALAAALSLAMVLWLAAATAAEAGALVDAAGRRVLLPDNVSRVLPAERNAEVLIFVLAPDKLAGLEGIRERSAATRRAVALLGWRPRSTPASMAATARTVAADLIVDAGTVTPDRAAFADEVQRLTGIPYILVDDGFARMPQVLRALGAVLGVADRAGDLATFAEHSIAALRGRLLIRPPNTRPRVYYGLGPDGLSTPLPGSPAGGAINEAGALNVAAGLGRGGEVRITRAQLLAWNPDVIIAERRGFFDSLRRDRQFRQLAAVRDKHVYLEPTDPFGWIEDPSGVNRLIGLYWLSRLFYPDATQEDLRTTACEFYDKFYRIKLTNRRLEQMVVPAGASPAEAPRPVSEPLVGLGAAPPSSLAPATPGAPNPNAANPRAPNNPAALPPVPGMPNTSPTAACTVPTGPMPQPLPGITSNPPPSPSTGIPSDLLPPSNAPAGVPPPGRRGRPTGQPGGASP